MTVLYKTCTSHTGNVQESNLWHHITKSLSGYLHPLLGNCYRDICPIKYSGILFSYHCDLENEWTSLTIVECRNDYFLPAVQPCNLFLRTLFIVRRARLLWSQQDFEWRWSVPLFKCLTVLEFSFILFDLCLLITFFNFIMNYVPIVTFWIFTYHKIWILSIMFCFIWSYWIIYFLACLEVSWRVVS